jgi:anaerobic magnesium-protoporphyrin IX monomethyl ester cyclase
MKILLVAPQFNQGRFVPETPSRALLILGTLAKQRGHEVMVESLDLIGYDGYGDVLKEFRPDILGITSNTFQVKSARLAVRQAKEWNKDVRVIIGGPHMPAWENIADETVVIGEGENKFLEFIGENPDIVSIDDIPIPDYSLVDLDRYCGIAPIANPPAMAIMASRGCPFQCRFCNTPLFWGSKVRYRKPLYVVDEVELLHKMYGINEIFFQDDTFNLNHEWAFAIFNDIIKRGLNKEMLFKIDCRVNEKLLTQDFLSLAYKAGVWNIFYGIESGSQEMLDRMHKGITVEEIKRAIPLTHSFGIKSQCSFIVGLPGETLTTLKETEELISEINPTRYGWCFYCPFPGTQFEKEVTASGHKLDIPYDEFGYGSVHCRTNELDYEELKAFEGFHCVRI